MTLFRWLLLALLVWFVYRVYQAKKAGFSWTKSIKSTLPFGLGNSASVAAPPSSPS